MLSVFEKGIIELIRCAFKGGVPNVDESFDFEKAYDFAQQRQITPLLYYGAVNLPGFMDTLAGKKFFKSAMNMGFFCAEQSEIIKSVNEAFKQNKIQHMMLKGTILRSMYPYPEMRLMSDADILIKEEEYDTIKPIMQSLGFEEQYESNHEFVWQKNGFTIELHKRLIPSYNKDYYDYFGDGWKIATRRDEETNECFMSDEDNFIYTFVHYAKHYRDGGIGVKHATDFYVFIDKFPQMNWEYVEKELEKLQLLRFWQNTKNALEVWFFDRESNEITDFMTTRIFNSGAYGTVEDKLQAEAVRTGNTEGSVKRRKLLSIIFPSFEAMKQKYSVLKKVPILLPIMWVVRWVHAIFMPSKIRRQKKTLDMVSNESVSKYHNELKYVGLDFNFEEK